MTTFPPIADGESPVVLAHRGASRAARENTVEAFTEARRQGADAVELDVRRTSDGALVVHHDPTSPETGVLAERSLAEIRERAPHIPTLEEALEACNGMWVNIEVKNLPVDPDWDADDWISRTVASFVAASGLHDRILVSSFNPANLVQVREVDAEIATGLIVAAGFDALSALEAAAAAGHVTCNHAVEGLRDGVLDDVATLARESGVALVPWTVNEPAEMAQLVASGARGVITDVPDIAREVFDRPSDLPKASTEEDQETGTTRVKEPGS